MLKELVFRVAGLPRGHSPLHDLRFLSDARVVFDVGADDGKSVVQFLKAFPKAQIYSFEPARMMFCHLRDKFANNRRVSTFNTALGSTNGTARFTTDLVLTGLSRIDEYGKDEVPIETLDTFCAREGVEHIDFLKIDTEGHDLEVLKGAMGMLDRKAISAVQVEAGMSPENDFHVSFEKMKSYLDQRGYHAFGIYEQYAPSASRWLERVNAIFVAR